jgi:hypothetical protein
VPSMLESNSTLSGPAPLVEVIDSVLAGVPAL